ncbi:MAG TPA: methyltransferase [Chloroflexia bacterium]|nr:methyltransferase [Chloroflexia bacterium]
MQATRPTRPAWKRALGFVLKRGIGWRFRHFDPNRQPERWVRVAGLRLRVLPGVFNPALHFTSAFLADYLRRPVVIKSGSSVLDLGTGTGIAAIASARAGAGRVVAIDINPEAVKCAGHNIRAHQLQGQVDVRRGDLFAPVRDEQFDLIISNPPYFKGDPRTLAERAYMGGAQYEWIDRFASEAPLYLARGGSCLLVLGDAADVPAILARIRIAGWQIVEAARRDILVEVLHIFRLTWPQNPIGANTPPAQERAWQEGD